MTCEDVGELQSSEEVYPSMNACKHTNGRERRDLSEERCLCRLSVCCLSISEDLASSWRCSSLRPLHHPMANLLTPRLFSFPSKPFFPLLLKNFFFQLVLLLFLEAPLQRILHNISNHLLNRLLMVLVQELWMPGARCAARRC